MAVLELSGIRPATSPQGREGVAPSAVEGLARSDSHARCGITPMCVRDARNLIALQAVLEAEAAGLAARRGGDVEQLRELVALCGIVHETDDPASLERFIGAHRRFSLTMAAVAGNDRLTTALAGVVDGLERYLRLTLIHRDSDPGLTAGCRELLGAILASDQAAARSVARARSHALQRIVVDAVVAVLG